MMKRFSVSSLVVGLLLGILLVSPAAVIAKDSPATWHGLPTANLTVDGVAMDSERPPVIIDGATYVPLRLVMESLGSKVDWDEATRTVSVESPAATGSPAATATTTTTDPGAAVTFDPATADDYNAARGGILTAYALACTAAHQEFAAAEAAVISQLPGDDQLAARNEALAGLEAVLLQALADAKAARDAALADLKAMYGTP